MQKESTSCLLKSQHWTLLFVCFFTYLWKLKRMLSELKGNTPGLSLLLKFAQNHDVGSVCDLRNSFNFPLPLFHISKRKVKTAVQCPLWQDCGWGKDPGGGAYHSDPNPASRGSPARGLSSWEVARYRRGVGVGSSALLICSRGAGTAIFMWIVPIFQTWYNSFLNLNTTILHSLVSGFRFRPSTDKGMAPSDGLKRELTISNVIFSHALVDDTICAYLLLWKLHYIHRLIVKII